ncbi:hypothetical protein HB662_15110 [Roseomonas frigidaquae]|uniref:Protamine-2 (Modular protein) n=1 Tax=Falsiroseomonas frigidaquae TaxID=487318 RepID=A0ABX1F1E3_9PROT|nr:hypothetical protein [Falsiroseomonas frigidaquae]NKE46114.1 hypothetical protein [Falsiroseomonas frigidaquae]
MERRRFILAGLAGAIAAATIGGAEAATRAISTPSPAPLPEPTPEARPAVAEQAEVDALMQEVQWGPPPGRPRRGRRPRCWMERRRVAFRDRFGRIRHRWVERRVCR